MDEENTELSTEEITKEFGSGTSSLFDDDELEGEIEIKKEPIEDIKIKKEALGIIKLCL